MGDTLGLIMLENGDDPAKVTDESFDRALATMQTAAGLGPDPQVLRQRLRAAARDGRPRGEHARGRATSSTLADPKLKWVIPETGGIIWTDNMLIPLGGSVPTASTYMNFVYDPEIAAQLALGAELHLVGQGREGGGGEAQPGGGRRTRSSSRPTTCSRRCTRTTRRCSPTRTTRQVAGGAGQVGASTDHGLVLPPAPGRHALPPARARDRSGSRSSS